MQVGFAMLLAGSIREKNVANVLLWNLLDSAGGALAFWSIGYALAYGGDDLSKPVSFVGNTGFFLATPGIDLHFWYAPRCLCGPIFDVSCFTNSFIRLSLANIGSSSLRLRVPYQASRQERLQSALRWQAICSSRSSLLASFTPSVRTRIGVIMDFFLLSRQSRFGVRG